MVVDIFQKLDPVHDRHPDIRDQKVRVVFFYKPVGFVPGLCLPRDLKIGGARFDLFRQMV